MLPVRGDFYFLKWESYTADQHLEQMFSNHLNKSYGKLELPCAKSQLDVDSLTNVQHITTFVETGWEHVLLHAGIIVDCCILICFVNLSQFMTTSCCQQYNVLYLESYVLY